MLWNKAAGAGGFAPPPLSSSYLGNLVDTVDRSAYTFSRDDVSLGAADSTRHIVIAVGTTKASAAITPDSVTINGNSCTLLAEMNNSFGNNPPGVSFWIRKVTSGVDANVVVTYSTTVLDCRIAWWRVVGKGLITLTDKIEKTDTDGDIQDTIDVAAGGSLIAASMNQGSTNYTWTGPTEDFEANAVGREYSGAHADYSTAQTGLTVRANTIDTDNLNLVAVALR
jgi:hypothetical protein